MQGALRKKFVTEDEYLALEAASEVKHEYYNGEIFAMSGGSPAHALLGHNLQGSLFARLRGRRCRGASSDQRIKLPTRRDRAYADALIVCPPERYDERDADSLLNPKVIFEVLSPSTEKFDRTGKFDYYKQIESFSDYILIEQDRVRIEHYQRSEGELWTLRVVTQRDQTIVLADLEIEIPLSEIYDRLEVPDGLMLVDEQA